MTEKYRDQLERLAGDLVTPERFGKLVVIENPEPELCEKLGQLSLVDPEIPPDEAA